MDRFFPAFVTLHQHGDLEGAAAFAAWRPKETVITRSKEDILARIQVALASRAAEELFLDVNLSGVTSDFASATQFAALYIGAFGMDGTLTSYLAFANPLAGTSPMALPKMADRVEDVLQSQFKAVKRLFQEHSEAVTAVAEALIERNELVADEIKQLIDDADARRVSRVVISDFEPMLGNGHSNGKNGGYVLAAGRGNGSAGSGHTTETPTDSQPLGFTGDQTDNMQLPPTNSGPSFFVGG